MQNLTTQPQIHVRYGGNSFDIDLDTLDVGVLSSDAQIRTAVATHLDVPVVKLQVFAVERNQETGDLTMRPEAVFGS